ncbi:MAG: hypothetical protein GF349_03760 [Candidatus Magasanikbacteria bacterium]|nr:hypothetical protein [Candidatus Magasanikbacteria bacterium]
MPDQYTETTKTGWGTRLGRSFKGIFIGILLFIASFVLLYWNEGRLDLSTIASEAINIPSTEFTDDPLEGSLISTTGVLTTEETLSDDMYLEQGDYVKVERIVEMYAWVEKSESSSEINYGGSETTETTYSYEKEWTSNPQNSSGFKVSEGHENPSLDIQSETFVVEEAKVGVYKIDPQKMSLLSGDELMLSEDLVDFGDEYLTSIRNNYIYKEKSYSDGPEVGDIRIMYKVLRPNQDVTVFGKLSGSSIVPYTDQKEGATIYRMFSGTPEQAVVQMHSEYTWSIWVLRILGLILMWVGLMMVLEPISTLLDVLPFMGSLSRGLVKLLTFIIAFVLSVVTIVISMIFHNIIALVIVLVIVVGAIIFFVKTKGKDMLTKKKDELKLKQNKE